jgi:hypothetical protein
MLKLQIKGQAFISAVCLLTKIKGQAFISLFPPV